MSMTETRTFTVIVAALLIAIIASAKPVRGQTVVSSSPVTASSESRHASTSIRRGLNRHSKRLSYEQLDQRV